MNKEGDQLTDYNPPCSEDVLEALAKIREGLTTLQEYCDSYFITDQLQQLEIRATVAAMRVAYSKLLIGHLKLPCPSCGDSDLLDCECSNA